jgi:hypothetical protein
LVIAKRTRGEKVRFNQKVNKRKLRSRAALVQPVHASFTKAQVQALFHATVTWINPGGCGNGCRVVRASPFLKRQTPSIRGAGVVSMQTFKSGEAIVCYTGQRITGSQANNQRWDNNYLFEVNGDKFILDGQNTQYASIARYINAPVYEEDINTAFIKAYNKVILMALRNIEIGEELIAHYGPDQSIITK